MLALDPVALPPAIEFVRYADSDGLPNIRK